MCWLVFVSCDVWHSLCWLYCLWLYSGRDICVQVCLIRFMCKYILFVLLLYALLCALDGR